MNRILLMMLVVVSVCVGLSVAPAPTQKLQKKWAQLFKYLNTHAPAYEGAGLLTQTDYTDLKRDLQRFQLTNGYNMFNSMATDVADMYYPLQRRAPRTNQTEHQYVNWIGAKYASSSGALNRATIASNVGALYDGLLSAQQTGSVLTKETIILFQNGGVRRVSVPDVQASLNKITTSDNITKQQLTDAVVGYLTGRDASLEDMPLLGPYLGTSY